MSEATLRAPRSGPAQVTQHRIPSWVWKLIMAVTGGTWALFVLIHLFGNLKIYMGPDAYNGYSAWLRTVGYPLLPHYSVLWIMRIVLVAFLVLHIVGAVTIWARKRKNMGPVGVSRKLSFSRLMLPGGILIGAFILVHVLDLTVGAVVAADSFQHGSAYENVIASLSRPWMGIFYLIVMLVVACHLWHGIQLLFNDLGATTKRWRTIGLIVAFLVAIVIVLGNAMIPVGIFGGWIS